MRILRTLCLIAILAGFHTAAGVDHPVITSLSPSSATVQGQAFTLVVNGRGFQAASGEAGASTVTWNDRVLTTTFVNSAQLTAAVPAALIAQKGTAQIKVYTDVYSVPSIRYNSNVVDFRINDPAPIQLTQSRLSFTGAAGGDDPAPLSFLVSAADASTVGFRITTPGAAWLRVTPPTGATPARVQVQPVTANLAAGAHQARITVTTQAQTVELPVELALSTVPAQLDASPQILQFNAKAGGQNPADQVLLVRNSGSGSLDFNLAVAGRSPWLRLSSTAARTTPGVPAAIRVSVDALGLLPGAHRDVIRLISGSQTLEVPVSLFIPAAGPVLGLNFKGFQFEARQGYGTTLTRGISVLNLGEGTLNWSAELLSGAEWARISTNANTATAAQPGAITVSVNTANLAAGSYYALLRVSSPNAAGGSPQFFTIVTDVAPQTAAARPVPTPSGLLFISPAGNVPPAAQEVRLFTSSAGALGYRAAANTASGASWLSVRTVNENSSTQTPGSVSVTVNPAGLAPGIYSGEVTMSVGTGTAQEARSVGITYIVTPPAANAASKQPREAAGCTPTRLAPVNTGLVANFSAAAGWPTPLTIRLRDDCGDPVPNGQVVATFSNGDPPLSMKLVDAANAIYTTTWVPGTAAGTIAVTANASAIDFPVARLQFTGAVQPNRAPILRANSVLHNFRPPQPGAPLAPGLVAALFGSDLAAADTVAPPGALPRRLNNTSVLVGGVEAPLYFASSGQVNLQIPFELAPDREYQVVVNANGALTAPETVALAAVQPGVAAFPDGTIIAQHADGSLITAESPARPEEVIVTYLAGLGATDPAIPSGEASPIAEPLARVTMAPTVTVDGQPAEIFYAGLAPFFVGLYQINLRVPAGLPDGDLELVVRQGGAVSNVTRLPVRR